MGTYQGIHLHSNLHLCGEAYLVPHFLLVFFRAYDEAIHWRRNLFSVPVGRAGTQFVNELARLFQSFADGSALEGVALKAAMLLPILLFQKPHFKSRSREDA